jgi:DNA-binding transcriptional MerR regulator
MTNRQSRSASAEAPEPATSRPHDTHWPERPPEAPGAPLERAADTEANTPAETAQIDEVAARTGLTKRALRYYEEIGLLDRPTRTGGNYRQYTERDIARLESIKRWRELLGFSLSDIRELVRMEEERQQVRSEWTRASHARHRLDVLDHSDTLARRTLDVVEQKISGLEEMRTELRERLERHDRMRAELHTELATETNGAHERPGDVQPNGAHEPTHEPTDAR